MTKQKVCVYVDGFNFYYGLKSKQWKRFYWLDMVSFFEKFLKPHQELISVSYFSAKPHDVGKQERQDLLFTANNLNSKFKLELGRYMPKNIKCLKCSSLIKSFEEKETDVKIATRIISDVVGQICDVTILVSADSDLTPPLNFIREYKPNHKIFVYFPPNRFSSNLHALADNTKKLEGSSLIFSQNLLPDEITLSNGYVVKRPYEWR